MSDQNQPQGRRTGRSRGKGRHGRAVRKVTPAASGSSSHTSAHGLQSHQVLGPNDLYYNAHAAMAVSAGALHHGAWNVPGVPVTPYPPTGPAPHSHALPSYSSMMPPLPPGPAPRGNIVGSVLPASAPAHPPAHAGSHQQPIQMGLHIDPVTAAQHWSGGHPLTSDLTRAQKRSAPAPADFHEGHQAPATNSRKRPHVDSSWTGQPQAPHLHAHSGAYTPEYGDQVSSQVGGPAAVALSTAAWERQVSSAAHVSAVLILWTRHQAQLPADALSVAADRLGELVMADGSQRGEVLAQPTFVQLCLRARLLAEGDTLLPESLGVLLQALQRIKPSGEGQLLDALAAAVARGIKAGQCAPADLPLVLAAFVDLGHVPVVQLLDSATEFLLQSLDAYTVQEAAASLWALAKLGFRPRPPVLAGILNTVSAHVRGLNLQELSRLLWACATTSAAVPEGMLHTTAAMLMEALPNVEDAVLASMLHAFGELGYVAPGGLLRHVAASLAVDTMALGPLMKLVTAFAMQHHHPGADVMGAAVRRLLGATSSRPLPVTAVPLVLDAFATFAYNPGQRLLDAVMAQVQTSLHALTAEQLAGLLWCLVLFQAATPSLWNLLVGALVAHDSADTPPAALNKLYEAYLLVEGSALAAGCVVPSELLATAWASWKAGIRASAAAGATPLALEVSDELNAMGVPHQINVTLEGGAILADILVRAEHCHDGKSVVLLALPQASFSRNLHEPLGRTLMQTRVLEERGWQVLIVPYYEWQGSSTAAKTTMLDRLLAPVLLAGPQSW